MSGTNRIVVSAQAKGECSVEEMKDCLVNANAAVAKKEPKKK
jgi:hypothetical protein